MKNKVVVITGASSGIGAALAAECAGRGALLALSDIHPEQAEHWLEQSGAKGLVEGLDVSHREAVLAHIARVERELGPIDVIINNAGVALSATVAEMSIDDFRWLMDINFWGVVYGTQSVLPGMLERNSGTIVNISSLFGLIGVPTQSAYNASKFAVRGFTEALRAEVSGSGVKVLCVHPGGIKTNIARNSRFVTGIDGCADKGEAVRDFDRLAKVEPAKAAKLIIDAVIKGKSRLLIGHDAKILDLLQRGFPTGYSAALTTLIAKAK